MDRFVSRIEKEPHTVTAEAAWLLFMCKRGIAYDSLHDPLFTVARKFDNPAATPLASWKTLKDSTLGALYSKVIELQQNSLRESESAAISFDGWTGTPQQGQIIGVHYHWIDSNWSYHSALLDLIEVQGAHTKLLAAVPTYLTYLTYLPNPGMALSCHAMYE